MNESIYRPTRISTLAFRNEILSLMGSVNIVQYQPTSANERQATSLKDIDFKTVLLNGVETSISKTPQLVLSLIRSGWILQQFR